MGAAATVLMNPCSVEERKDDLFTYFQFSDNSLRLNKFLWSHVKQDTQCYISQSANSVYKLYLEQNDDFLLSAQIGTHSSVYSICSKKNVSIGNIR